MNQMNQKLIVAQQNNALELQIEPTNFERLTNALIKNVSASTRRIYEADARQFGSWLAERGLSLADLTYEDMSEYRAWLDQQYSNKPTAARKLVVARRLLDVAVILKLRQDNPAKQVKGFKSSQDETPHRALTKNEARDLLAAIDQTTAKGKRDFALISLLLRTGLRRAEAAALTLGDLSVEQGHNIITIRHGKGEKRRVVKLPVDVRRAIDDYLDACGRVGYSKDASIFIRFSKGDKPKESGISGDDIERIVEQYAAASGLEGLTPHGLRASFVTLTLEAGAKLHQVQYFVGHANPMTTERYQRRKLNLDDSAADYLKL